MSSQDEENETPVEEQIDSMTDNTIEEEGIPDDILKSSKRKERLEQNRISARESRKRKKSMIEELQRTVITLSRDNKELNDRNESLRRELIEIGTKYPSIVPFKALLTGMSGTDPKFDQKTAGSNASVAPFTGFPVYSNVVQQPGGWSAPATNVQSVTPTAVQPSKTT